MKTLSVYKQRQCILMFAHKHTVLQLCLNSSLETVKKRIISSLSFFFFIFFFSLSDRDWQLMPQGMSPCGYLHGVELQYKWTYVIDIDKHKA